MKVYIVFEVDWDWEHHEIDGVFASKEDAEEYMNKMNRDKKYYFYELEEHEVKGLP